MNSKGFTLFTALIAFILIVLSLLLVQSMVSTERSSSDIISDISEQEEMQALADLARADSLQVFNFFVRSDIEKLSTRTTAGGSDSSVSYTIFPSTISSWENLKEEFVKERFGVSAYNTDDDGQNQFANRVARHLISLLEKTPNTRGFSFDLEKPSQNEMTQIMSTAFEEQVTAAQLTNFFEVIDCDDTYNSCIGTFYITIDLSEEIMDDIDYEKFPLIEVTKEQTGRTLKEPILPRGKFRIYVPIRLFKALKAAEEIGTQIFPLTGIPNGTEAAKNYIKPRVRTIIDAEGYETPQDEFVLDYWEISVLAPTELDAEGNPIPSSRPITSYTINLFFKDTNEKYQVSTKSDNIYGVSLKSA